MADLGMNQSEFEYYQRNYAEACKLIGQEALLFPVGTVLSDIYDDRTVSYDSMHTVGLIFDSNPRPILKKFNWTSEDDELPYVAYITPYDNRQNNFTITEDMLLFIKSKFGIESERRFIVRNVRGSSIDPLMFICKLTPYRPKVDFIPETSDKVEHTYKDDKDAGFSYLNRSMRRR